MAHPLSFNKQNFKQLCNLLAKHDADLKQIIVQYGYPPLFKRAATFKTLIHIILEQQVSLASAKAALQKLQQTIGTITPLKVLALSATQLRACYFSKQKIVYAQCLAKAIIDKQLNLKKLSTLSNENVIAELTKIKGIGAWTADVYLMMVLNRCNCFPIGDVALVNSIKKVKKLPHNICKNEILDIASNWQPYKTIAAYLLWWSYIKERNLKY